MKNKEYRRIAEDFLYDNPRCALDSKHKATDIHHVMGRVGYADKWARENDILLEIDTRYFKGLCRNCHNYVHDNENDPIIKEKGLYIKRSNTDLR